MEFATLNNGVKMPMAGIGTFLLSPDDEHRTVFVPRYWYFDPINELSAATGYSQGRVKNMLAKTRRALRGYLESEGVEL